MRYFVVEDRADVSVHDSFKSAINAVEPVDIPRVKLFDELGNEYPLSIGRKQIRFLGFWSTTVDSTLAGALPREAALELEDCLKVYVSKAHIQVPPDAGLRDLVEVTASYQGIE